MFLNDDDLLLFKYMIIDTGLINSEEARKIKDFNEIIDYLKENQEKELCELIINEALYHINCFNNLHVINDCPLKYKESEWGIDISDEIVLFVRLFQHLNKKELADLLEKCVGINLDQFLSLELHIDNINNNYVEEILNWLEKENNEFAENVKEMLDQRKMKCDIDEHANMPNLPSTKNNGICLVISNKTFKEYPTRNGTEKDEENIQNTFLKLGYEVQIHKNVLCDEMDSIFNELKETIESTHRMVILFALSHGVEGSIITSDDIEFPFKKIWEPFTNSNFDKFIGKPKLFFFVCCQGVSFNEAVMSNIEFDSPISRNKYPNVSNFFFGYATYKYYLSGRTKKNGTFYVKCLCKVIQEHPKLAINDIHQEVQRRLSLILINENSFQMPYCENILIDHVYLIGDDDI